MLFLPFVESGCQNRSWAEFPTVRTVYVPLLEKPHDASPPL